MPLSYQYNPAIWPSVFTIILLTLLAIYAWHRRNLPGAWCFVIYCIFGLLFLAAKVIEFLAVDFDTKIFWFNIEYPWWMPGTTALTCFVLEYAWPGRWVTRRSIAVFSIVPLMGLVFLFTNHFHSLAFIGYDFTGDIVPLYGPVGWLFLFYNLGLRAISISALVWLFIRSPQHRWPATLILVAETVVGVVLVLDPYIQESEFFYVPEKSLPVIACAVALFGFRILNPIPLAHRTVIEQLQAGMLVLDLDGKVISLNPAAESILNAPAKQVEGRPIDELLPAYPQASLVGSSETEITIAFGEGTTPRYYMLRNSLLKDFRGLEVGSLLLMTDVTEQKRAHTQIVDQQRSLAMLHEREQLARELHDNIGQIFAFVNVQGQTIHRLLSRGDFSTADDYVVRLLEVAREADVDFRESISGLRATIIKQGLLPTLTHYLARYEKNYGIETRLEVAESFRDEAFEPLVEVQLLRILQEALTNVRKHAIATRVQIMFGVEDGCARITIHDDGRGFDPGAVSTGLEGHVGLHVMHERAEEIGGSLNLRSAPGQGTEVIVCIPMKGADHV